MPGAGGAEKGRRERDREAGIDWAARSKAGTAQRAGGALEASPRSRGLAPSRQAPFLSVSETPGLPQVRAGAPLSQRPLWVPCRPLPEASRLGPNTPGIWELIPSQGTPFALVCLSGWNPKHVIPSPPRLLPGSAWLPNPTSSGVSDTVDPGTPRASGTRGETKDTTSGPERPPRGSVSRTRSGVRPTARAAGYLGPRC